MGRRADNDMPTSSTPNLEATAEWQPCSDTSCVSDIETSKPPARQSVGRFQLKGLLGHGGFGTVYHAYDPALDRDVALKVPSAGVLTSERDVARFLTEARAAGRLQHPNIVAVYESGTAEGTHYIATALIGGATLHKLMASQPFGHPQAAALVAKLAEALHHAHSLGVIHRDIKPGNIMLTADGVPHILDFGLARREGGSDLRTREGTQLGTLAYMSPEQASGNSHLADARSDIWSLGVVLYELLTRRRPFEGEFLEVLDGILTCEPTPPRRLDRSIALDLETICLKCLSKAHDERYATAAQLQDDLQRYLAGGPISARPIGRVQRSWRWARRHPLQTALAVALSGGIGSSLYLSSQWKGAADRAHIESTRAKQYAGSVQSAETRETFAQEQLRRHLETSAREQLAKGIELCNDGAIASGVHWMVRGLDTVPQNSSTLQSLIRRNIASWIPLLNTLENQFQVPGGVYVVRTATAVVSYAFEAGPRQHVVRFWDSLTGQAPGGPARTAQFGPAGSHHRFVGCSSDLKCVVFASTGSEQPTSTIERWDTDAAQRLEPVLRFEGSLLRMDLPRDAKLAAAVIGLPRQQSGFAKDYQLCVWDLHSGTTIWQREFKGASRVPHAPVLSPDATRALVADPDGSPAQLWDLASGEPQGDALRLDGYLASAAFSADGTVLITADGTARVRLWDGRTGKPIRGRFFEPGTGRILNSPLEGRNTDHITSVSLTPDGRFLLTLGRTGETIRLWDLETGTPVGQSFPGETGLNVFSDHGYQAISDDGAVVVIASGTTVRVWKVARMSRASGSWPDQFPSIDMQMASVDEVRLWTEVATGMELTVDDTFRVLDSAAWQERRVRLAAGIPPAGER